MATDRGPLGDLRVIEHTSGLAGAYAGFLLAGLGADVVKVEPPGARRVRPGDHVLHRSKRSITLDAGADPVVQRTCSKAPLAI